MKPPAGDRILAVMRHLAILASLLVLAGGCSKHSTAPHVTTGHVAGVVLRQDGSGAATALVVLERLASGIQLFEPLIVEANGSGAWSFDPVDTGRYVVSTHVGSAADAETVAVGMSTPDVTLRLAPAGRFAGVVLDDASGVPAAHAIVIVQNLLSGSEVDSSGRYVLTGVPTGNWTLFAVTSVRPIKVATKPVIMTAPDSVYVPPIRLTALPPGPHRSLAAVAERLRRGGR